MFSSPLLLPDISFQFSKKERQVTEPRCLWVFMRILRELVDHTDVAPLANPAAKYTCSCYETATALT